MILLITFYIGKIKIKGEWELYLSFHHNKGDLENNKKLKAKKKIENVNNL